MSKTLEGMARTFFEELDKVTAEEAMSAAVIWLSYNVTDEMLRHMHDAWIEWSGQDSGRWEYCLKAALRAAAGSALEAKP